MIQESIVQENLMNVPGYSPYCGLGKCYLRWPRTTFNKDKKQFTCECGWVSEFPADFINSYIERWKK